MKAAPKPKPSKNKTTKALSPVHQDSIISLFHLKDQLMEEEKKNNRWELDIAIDSQALRIINAPEEKWTKYKNIINTKGIFIICYFYQ